MTIRIILSYCSLRASGAAPRLWLNAPGRQENLVETKSKDGHKLGRTEMADYSVGEGRMRPGTGDERGTIRSGAGRWGCK